MIDWMHAWPSMTAAFLASIVEFVEALTVVLAVGSIRGWRDTLIGAIAAVLALALIVVVLGPGLSKLPLSFARLAVGTLLLLFGLRWLRKAALRAAGVISLHDEDAAFAAHRDSMRGQGGGGGRWDAVAFGTAFKITMLEGLEVVFIVVAVGAGGAGLLLPAALGALFALIVVAMIGLAVHRPLSRVPENTLKLVVGVLLSAFGTFWFGEGLGSTWPGDDLALIPLVLAYFTIAAITVALAKRQRAAPTGTVVETAR